MSVPCSPGGAAATTAAPRGASHGGCGFLVLRPRSAGPVRLPSSAVTTTSTTAAAPARCVVVGSPIVAPEAVPPLEGPGRRSEQLAVPPPAGDGGRPRGGGAGVVLAARPRCR
ncbi:unnamed protein product [Urochloa humidicola]